MTDKSEARNAAEAFRAQQHLGTAPIADLVTVLEAVGGVHVAVLPKTDSAMHGMRATDPERGVTILAAAATPHAMRLRSTLAHELAHHLFNDPTPENWSENTPEEQRATEFARHLLIPLEGVADVLGEPGTGTVTEAVLSKIVERFAVSPQMAAIQLEHGGYIDSTTCEQFKATYTRNLATRYGWSALYHQWSTDSEKERPPQRIVAAATSAYIDNNGSLEAVAHLRNEETSVVASEFAAAGITPADADETNPDAVVHDLTGDDLDWDSFTQDGTA